MPNKNRYSKPKKNQRKQGGQQDFKDIFLDNRFNWIVYGICFPIAPFALMLFCKWFIGYKINLNEIIPDYILIVYAIAVSIINFIVDSEESFKKKYWRVSRAISSGTILFCIFFYACTNNAFVNNYMSQKLNEIGCSFIVLLTVIMVINIFLGILLRYRLLKYGGSNNNQK